MLTGGPLGGVLWVGWEVEMGPALLWGVGCTTGFMVRGLGGWDTGGAGLGGDAWDCPLFGFMGAGCFGPGCPTLIDTTRQPPDACCCCICPSLIVWSPGGRFGGTCCDGAADPRACPPASGGGARVAPTDPGLHGAAGTGDWFGGMTKGPFHAYCCCGGGAFWDVFEDLRNLESHFDLPFSGGCVGGAPAGGPATTCMG